MPKRLSSLSYQVIVAPFGFCSFVVWRLLPLSWGFGCFYCNISTFAVQQKVDFNKVFHFFNIGQGGFHGVLNIFNRVFNIANHTFHYTKGKTFGFRVACLLHSANKLWNFESFLAAGCIHFSAFGGSFACPVILWFIFFRLQNVGYEPLTAPAPHPRLRQCRCRRWDAASIFSWQRTAR